MRRRGTQELIFGLTFGENSEDINRQLVSRMRRDPSDDEILDVIAAFYVLSAAEWPGSAKYFRLYVQLFPELWTGELNSLPAVERAVGSVQTLRAMGLPDPAGVCRVAVMAERELARRDGGEP